MTIHGITYTEKFIDNLVNKYGYEVIQLEEGCLGLGDLVLLAPDEKKYNFVIKEIYLSAYSSGQTIRRAAKISKALQKQIDKVIEY